MEKLTRTEINCETGEEIIIELSPEEAKAWQEEVAILAKKREEEEAAIAAAEAKKVAVLEKLGLTAEEASLLLA